MIAPRRVYADSPANPPPNLPAPTPAIKDVPSRRHRPSVPEAGGEASGALDSLAGRVERLALEEWAAVRRRDWTAARDKALEKVALQEALHRALARRWS